MIDHTEERITKLEEIDEDYEDFFKGLQNEQNGQKVHQSALGIELESAPEEGI